MLVILLSRLPWEPLLQVVAVLRAPPAMLQLIAFSSSTWLLVLQVSAWCSKWQKSYALSVLHLVER